MNEAEGFLLATVDKVFTDGATLLLDGQSVATQKHYKKLGGQTLTAGDRVLVIKHSGTYIVLGTIST